jgi:hypothetical protein
MRVRIVPALSSCGSEPHRQMITGGKLDSVAGISMHHSAVLSSLNRAPVKNLPGKATMLCSAKSNSTFRKKLLDTYHAIPYAVQARADMFSPQFFEDLDRLTKKRVVCRKDCGKTSDIQQNDSETSQANKIGAATTRLGVPNSLPSPKCLENFERNPVWPLKVFFFEFDLDYSGQMVIA